jgi:hypothetical protein
MRDRPRDEHLIEVLPADDAAWGPMAEATEAPDTEAARPTRPTVIIAGLVVAALIGVTLVVVSAGSDETASPTTTTEPATTDPAQPLVPKDEAVGASPYFVIDDPSLRSYSADVVTPRSADARFWILSSGTARAPWLSLQLEPGGSRPYVFANASRRVVAGHELITSLEPPFATDIMVGAGDGPRVRVHGVGIPASDLSALARSITATADEVFFDDTITSRLGLAVTANARWSADLVYGAVETQMSALTAEGSLVVLRVAPGSADTRPATLAFLAEGPVTDDEGYTSARFTATGESIVIWSAGGHLLSLVAAVPVADLVAIARTVRRVPAGEWQQLLYGLHPDYRIGDFATLATGAVAREATGDQPWQAGVQLAERDGQTLYLWWWTAADDVDSSASRLVDADLAAEPRVDTVVVEGTTYVFVSVPIDDPAQVARVRAADGSETVVPLTQPFAGVAVRMGATRTDVSGEVTVWFDEPADVIAGA